MKRLNKIESDLQFSLIPRNDPANAMFFRKGKGKKEETKIRAY